MAFPEHKPSIVNSNIIYDGSAATDVTTLLAPQNQSSKLIQDGQLIIRKNGVQYNAQGAILK